MTFPTVSLHNGKQMPQLGLGVWRIDNSALPKLIQAAFKLGCRAIDTASIYDNETGVGQAIKNTTLARDELFITTKLWNTDHAPQKARTALKESLHRLGLTSIDLYLIHWPVPKNDLYVQAWETLIALKEEGLVDSIGVCNFTIPHLKRLIQETGITPVINQVELHPGFQQRELREFHAQHQIKTQAWSPLAQGTLWDHPLITTLAKQHQKTQAQILLRWQIQQGNLLNTKSSNPDRLAENFSLFDFELSARDMQAIANLDKPDGRLGPDPDLFRLPKAGMM